MAKHRQALRGVCRETEGERARAEEVAPALEVTSITCVGAVLPGSLWPIILLRLALSPPPPPPQSFGLTQGPPLRVRPSFSHDGFHPQGSWEVDEMYWGLVPPPFSDPRGTSCECVVPEVSLTSGMRTGWPLSFVHAGRSSFLLLESFS